MTIKHLLKKANLPQLDAEFLLSHAIGKSRTFLIAYPEHQVSLKERMRFAWYTYERKRKVPAHHIVKQNEFFDLDFYVNKHVLVPRAATEAIVELALKELEMSDLGLENCIVVDVGTGAGNIPVAIGTQIADNRNQITIVATEISRSALRVAKKNGKKHNVDIQFLHGNLLKPLIKNTPLTNYCSLIITANLPYLTENIVKESPSISREPRVAQIGGSTDGLGLYRELLDQIISIVSNFDIRISCFFEMDPEQIPTMKKEILLRFPDADIDVVKDLGQMDRVVVMKLK